MRISWRRSARRTARLPESQRQGHPEIHTLPALQILREAGLIRGERRGVEMHNTSRCTEIEQRFPGLIRAIVNAHAIQSADEARAKRPVAKRPAKRAAANK